MKNISRIFVSGLILSLSILNTSVIASDITLPSRNKTAQQDQIKSQQVWTRIQEIKAMDKANLSREERRELRKELRELKKEARPVTSGGVYLSVGAILLIILALIILL